MYPYIYSLVLKFSFPLMQLFYKIVATGADINFNTYSILLKNLLSAGNWRKYIEVTLGLLLLLSNFMQQWYKSSLIAFLAW